MPLHLTGSERMSFRAGPRWPWFICSGLVFAFFLGCQLQDLWKDHVSLPFDPTVTLPTVVGWMILGVLGWATTVFSTQYVVTLDSGRKSIYRMIWVLFLLPIPGGIKSYNEVLLVRIGLDSFSGNASSGVAPGCFAALVGHLFLRTIFGAIGSIFYYFIGYPDGPTESGVPVAQILFADRRAWLIARGSENRVGIKATQAAEMIGVRLGV